MSYDKKYVELNNGMKMPIIGLGTWQARAEEVKTAVKTALELGYRHIDTAYAYQNEEEIGDVIKDMLSSGKIKREDLFIVTKLPANGIRPKHVKHFLDMSLKKLQLDYVDLYLIHCFFGFQHVSDDNIFPMENGVTMIDPSTDLIKTWKKMEEMVDLGLTKSIGVSNFSYEQIQRILNDCRIKPVTNQVECHAYFPQRKLFDFCHKNGITITAYAPIGSPGLKTVIKEKPPILLDDPVVKRIGEKYKKTASQILLRWLIQRGIIVIPKSATPSRIKENFEVFDFKLSPEDQAAIDGLDKNLRMFQFTWFKGVENHPEYKKWAEHQ